MVANYFLRTLGELRQTSWPFLEVPACWQLSQQFRFASKSVKLRSLFSKSQLRNLFQGSEWNTLPADVWKTMK